MASLQFSSPRKSLSSQFCGRLLDNRMQYNLYEWKVINIQSKITYIKMDYVFSKCKKYDMLSWLKCILFFKHCGCAVKSLWIFISTMILRTNNFMYVLIISIILCKKSCCMCIIIQSKVTAQILSKYIAFYYFQQKVIYKII